MRRIKEWDVKGFLTPELEYAILRAIESQRKYEPIEAVENLLKAYKAGNLEIVSSEVNAPPAENGEVEISFKFHVRAVSK